MSKKQALSKDMADSLAILQVLKVSLDNEHTGAAATTLEHVLPILRRVEDGLTAPSRRGGRG